MIEELFYNQWDMIRFSKSCAGLETETLQTASHISGEKSKRQ